MSFPLVPDDELVGNDIRTEVNVRVNSTAQVADEASGSVLAAAVVALLTAGVWMLLLAVRRGNPIEFGLGLVTGGYRLGI